MGRGASQLNMAADDTKRIISSYGRLGSTHVRALLLLLLLLLALQVAAGGGGGVHRAPVQVDKGGQAVGEGGVGRQLQLAGDAGRGQVVLACIEQDRVESAGCRAFRTCPVILTPPQKQPRYVFAASG
jgi:hypothetical protein